MVPWLEMVEMFCEAEEANKTVMFDPVFSYSKCKSHWALIEKEISKVPMNSKVCLIFIIWGG